MDARGPEIKLSSKDLQISVSMKSIIMMAFKETGSEQSIEEYGPAYGPGSRKNRTIFLG